MNRGSQDLAWVSSTMVESTGSKAFHTVFNAAWSLLQHPTVDVGVDDGRDPEREEIEEWYDWKRITHENMAIRGVCKATQQKQWFVSARLEIMRTMDWFRCLVHGSTTAFGRGDARSGTMVPPMALRP